MRLVDILQTLRVLDAELLPKCAEVFAKFDIAETGKEVLGNFLRLVREHPLLRDLSTGKDKSKLALHQGVCRRVEVLED